MNSLPIEYLHLETGVIPLFLAMVAWMQFRRAQDPNYDVNRSILPLRWMPWFFILMAAVFSGFLYRTSPLFGLELAAGIALSLLHPVNALCFTIHMMILRPTEMDLSDPVLALMPRFGVLLCSLSWLMHADQHARLSWKNLRGSSYLMAFALWSLLTIVKAPNPMETLTFWLGGYFKSLTLFAMIVLLVDSEISVREIELTLVISVFSLIVNALYQFVTGTMVAGRLKTSGALGDPNDLGSIIVMTLPFAVIPALEESAGPIAKTAALLYAGMAASVIWLTRSRGTMLAVVAQFLVYRFVRSKRNRAAFVLSAGILVGAYFGLMNILPRNAGDTQVSTASRITFWKTAGNMAAHFPLTGVGFDQYPDNYMTYLVGRAYEEGRRTAHSAWFLALGETGFPGFLLFCAFFSSVASTAWRGVKKRPGQLYALAGFAVAMSFLSDTYNAYYHLLAALILASASVASKAPTKGPARAAVAAE
jgi:hypothetical protein